MPTNPSFRAVELPSTNSFPKASCAPGIRRSASPDPSLDRNRSLIHCDRSSGKLAVSTAARSHDPLSVTWVRWAPLRWSTVRSPIQPKYHLLVRHSNRHSVFFVNMVYDYNSLPLHPHARLPLIFIYSHEEGFVQRPAIMTDYRIPR